MINFLIVDDEPMMRYLLKNLIPWEQNNFKIIGEAINGKDALEFLNKNSVDIILTDLRMPVMDGLSLIKSSKDNNLNGIFIVLSAYDEFHLVSDSFKLGASDYILKSELTDKTLLKTINALISRHCLDKNFSLVSKAKKYINQHYNEEICLDSLAKMLGITSAYLSMLFSKDGAAGFCDYIADVRIKAAIEHMKNSNMKMYEIGEIVGFLSSESFSRTFKKITGKSPKQYMHKDE